MHNATTFSERRQRVLAYLMKTKTAIDAQTQDLAEVLTMRLCDSMIDYLSTGHFQIFQNYVPRSHEYAAIEATTRDLMAFNDRFGNGGQLNLGELRAALEHTAYVLDTRMELEDDLIAAHRQPQRVGRASRIGALATA